MVKNSDHPQIIFCQIFEVSIRQNFVLYGSCFLPFQMYKPAILAGKTYFGRISKDHDPY